MRSARPLDPELQKAIQRGYEDRDVSVSILIKWAVGLFAFVSITSGITMAIYLLLVPRDVEKHSQWPLMTQRRLPPSPIIQANPVAEIQEYRAQEDQIVKSYGKDPKTGVEHIP